MPDSVEFVKLPVLNAQHNATKVGFCEKDIEYIFENFKSLSIYCMAASDTNLLIFDGVNDDEYTILKVIGKVQRIITFPNIPGKNYSKIKIQHTALDACDYVVNY